MTAQLIREITAEARSTGQSLVYDPEAPPESFDESVDTPPAKPKPAAKGKDAKAPPPKESVEDGQDPDQSETDSQDPEVAEAE